MATDLNVTVECPACGRPIPLHTQAVEDPGQLFLTFDTAPVREHVAAHHSKD
ncbi:hypothetical protein [Streptomyces sp. NPDC093111]|uniref:hypothetical protein n=1 Tax=Streptomyces sp. NPDC093111 TaxID=3154978 RepID=UPI003434C873